MNHSFVVSDDGTSAWSKQAAASASKSNKEKVQSNQQAPKVDNTELENLILGTLDKNGSIADTADFTVQNNVTAEVVDPVLKSLSALEYIVLEVIERKKIELTDEGKSYAANGSPEFQFVSKMKMGEKVDMAEMESRVGAQIAKIGFGKAMKQKWIKKDGNQFERIAADPVDLDKQQLNKFVDDPNLEAHDKK